MFVQWCVVTYKCILLFTNILDRHNIRLNLQIPNIYFFKQASIMILYIIINLRDKGNMVNVCAVEIDACFKMFDLLFT